LSGGGTSGAVTINANTTYLQRRVSSTCPEGQSIRIINADGTVNCEIDDAGGGTPSGTVTTLDGASAVGTSSDYSRGDHKHGIGTGAITSTHILNGSVTATDVNDTSIQRRVTGGCSPSSYMRGINQDGTVVCEGDSVGWSLTGNAGTLPTTNFIGTTDNVRLNFRVNNEVVFRLIPNTTSPNIIGGRSFFTTGVYGATIGGGGESGYENRVTDHYGTVGGGKDNQAGDDAGTVDDNEYATVGGGRANIASNDYATVGGGRANIASSAFSVVGGGDICNAIGVHTTVGGGYDNTASGNSATIPGGMNNLAAGDYSFAAGRMAKANNDGCFVWGDSTGGDVSCDNDNRWVARASGGVFFYTNSTLTNGMYLAAGGSGWNVISDRNLKENFASVDGKMVLARLSEFPVTTWNYKSQDASIRHMGPAAQDFSAAFGLGEDDKFLNTIDVGGVALAAIQGLYQMVKEKEAEIKELKEAIGEISKRLAGMANPSVILAEQ
jgi:hypothetical protein